MPTYTYQCQKCSHMVDAFRKMADRDTPPDFCEQCGHKELKRPGIEQPAGKGFILKGVGWHDSDYNKTRPKRHHK